MPVRLYVVNHTYNLAGGDVCLFHADCRDALRSLPDNCIDSVCTDPPYALTSVVKRFGSPTSSPAQYGKDGAFARQSAGFMGKVWDTGEVAFDPAFWAEVLRVLKPGGHVAAMGGTRTYHHLACGIENAGFEIRDSLMWVYGTGFPKGLDISKQIDKMAGAEREVIGSKLGMPGYSDTATTGRMLPCQETGNAKGYLDITAPATDAAKEWQGWNLALKPAHEPIVLARKPLSEATVAANVLRWRTGALNIGACRVGSEVLPELRAGQAKLGTFERHDMVTPERVGRWPANVVHDGSAEVVEAFPITKSGLLQKHHVRHQDKKVNVYGDWADGAGSNFDGAPSYGDEGSAARFFYSAKASKGDRAGSKHPTIKPVSLMSWLVRLITPPNGITLDPFAGSGTTGQAALQNGFKAILCEREAEYVADIIRRLGSPPPLVPSQGPSDG